MSKIVGCTKDGLMDMIWCETCEHDPESIACIKFRRTIGHGYVED